MSLIIRSINFLSTLNFFYFLLFLVNTIKISYHDFGIRYFSDITTLQCVVLSDYLLEGVNLSIVSRISANILRAENKIFESQNFTQKYFSSTTRMEIISPHLSPTSENHVFMLFPGK